jgi:hypothetical protein
MRHQEIGQIGHMDEREPGATRPRRHQEPALELAEDQERGPVAWAIDGGRPDDRHPIGPEHLEGRHLGRPLARRIGRDLGMPGGERRDEGEVRGTRRHRPRQPFRAGPVDPVEVGGPRTLHEPGQMDDMAGAIDQPLQRRCVVEIAGWRWHRRSRHAGTMPGAAARRLQALDEVPADDPVAR